MEAAVVLITCIVNIALGLFVLLRDTKAVSSYAFMTMTVLISVWIIASFVTDSLSAGLIANDIGNKVAFAVGYGVVLAGLWFTYNFPVVRRASRLEMTLLAITSAYVIVLSFTPLIAGEVSLVNGQLSYSIGDLIWLYVAGFLALIVLIVRNLTRLPRRVTRQVRVQARLVLAAFVLSACFGLVTNVVIPAVSTNWQTTEFGPIATMVLGLVIVYAVVRHGLFDVRQAVVRTVTYALSLLTLAGLYFVIAYSVSTLFLNDTSSIQPFSIALALLLAFIFQPIKRFFDRLTNSLFYKDNYSIDDFLSKLTSTLNSTTDLRALLQRAALEILKTLKAEQVTFFIFLSADKYLSAGSPHHTKLPNKDMRALMNIGDGIIIASQLDSTNPVRKLLVSHHIEVVMPLLSNNGHFGYVCLGEHLNSGYTSRDIRALNTISDELVIAIQNAMSIHEVQELNETLQQRINEATKELRASNAQLQRLDEAKDEFISMASHQLRTPLTSIKGYISMILEGDAGKISEQQKHVLEEAFLSSERMVRLIGEFLNVSRLQTGKFTLEKHPTDFVQVIKQEVEGLQTSAKSRNLSLSFTAPKKFPQLNIDESKMRQVVMNFSDNAIYYSKEKTTIKLSLKIENGDVVFTVKDTGIGVPVEQQASLFNKFFRATNARQQRPDGTGVGLFLNKKVIDAHHGSIIFESKEGKGSTFGFRLPLAEVEATTSSAPQSE